MNIHRLGILRRTTDFASHLTRRAAGVAFLLICTLNSPLSAEAAKYDIVIPSTYSQPAFHDFSEQVGLAVAYLPLAPAEPLGLLGFDVGVEATAVKIDRDKTFWTALMTAGNTPPSYLAIPKLHAQKGLPFGIDIGLVYAKVPASNIGMFGGELKWAVLKGTLATPALAVRGSYTTLTGVDHLDVSTYGADVSVSKGIAFITPYLGIGQVWIKSSSDAPGVSLQDESLSATRAFVGAKLSLLVLSLAAEADFSKVPMYSLRASLSF
ncbi:MAG: hypothetical protein HY207_05720 [Nitrospirae bacterium]|nr:hypothetical protein [Nitrospirota bacterium]